MLSGWWRGGGGALDFEGGGWVAGAGHEEEELLHSVLGGWFGGCRGVAGVDAVSGRLDDAVDFLHL